MNDTDLKFCSLEFKEHVGGELNWDIEFSQIGDFNLLMGDNAQGKTRFCNVINFFREIHIDPKRGRQINADISAKLVFDDKDSRVVYEFNMKGVGQGQPPVFDEKIFKDKELLFSREKGVLLNELKNSEVENPFFPPDLPAIMSITDARFPTLNKLKAFFDRIIFHDGTKFRGNEFVVDRNAAFFGHYGANSASVLVNWKRDFPDKFVKIVGKFEKLFPFIKEGSFSTKEILHSNGQMVPTLVFTDKTSGKEITQHNWSDGMLRLIVLLALPETRSPQPNGPLARPSMLIVDEIENGLDFKALDMIINHYQEYSDLFTVLVTTHSPVACNLVDPEFWRIFKRDGERVKVFSPAQSEKDLDKVRRDLRDDNWNFYRHHISTSKLYAVK